MIPKRFLIYGAGAVGGFVGAHLAEAGHTVALLGRPPLVKAITQQGGLRVRSGDGEERLAAGLRAVASLRKALALGPYDYVVFTMKAYATGEAIREIEAAIQDNHKMPPIVCLQNGVGNEEVIGAAFGPERIIAGTLTTPVSWPEAGLIVEERRRGLAIASDSPHAEGVIEAFRATTLPLSVIPNTDSLKWSKLLLNVITQPTAAILDMPPAEIVADPRLFSIEIEALREAVGVMRLASIRPVNLPGTPARLLVALLTWLPTSLLRAIVGPMIARGRGDKIPSCHEDLLRGRDRTEIPWLNGAIALKADQIDRVAPINHVLALTLSDIASGRTPWEIYRGKPEMLISTVNVARPLRR